MAIGDVIAQPMSTREQAAEPQWTPAFGSQRLPKFIAAWMVECEDCGETMYLSSELNGPTPPTSADLRSIVNALDYNDWVLQDNGLVYCCDCKPDDDDY